MTHDSIPPRVSELEKAVHTHEHRITQLEKLPPRVGDLEASMRSMIVSVGHIERSQAELKDSIRQVIEHQNRQSGELAGYGKAAKQLGTIISLLTLANLAASFFM